MSITHRNEISLLAKVRLIYRGFTVFLFFSLSLMCFQKPLFINFYVSFSLFIGNLSKDERRSFCAKNAEKLPPTDLLKIHRSRDGPYLES